MVPGPRPCNGYHFVLTRYSIKHRGPAVKWEEKGEISMPGS